MGDFAQGVNEEFVLRALSALLDAAPYYRVIPIVTKLREFLQWFDGPEVSEYCSMIFEQIEEVVHRHQEIQISHKFHMFHCMWYI